MLIVLHPDITREDQTAIEARVRELGFTPHAIEGAGRTAIGITGNKGPVDPGHFRELPGVADCIPVTAPYKDRKSTRLNSSHLVISYAVFCLKKKKKNQTQLRPSLPTQPPNHY